MTSQTCMRICCKYVAAGEVNECGLGICNYYSQADKCLILLDGRAPLWVPGHAWRFQRGTLCKNTLEDASAQVCEFCALFCSISGKFWKVCGVPVVDRFGLFWFGTHFHPVPCAGHSSAGCSSIRISLISPFPLSEHNCWVFTSKFLIPMQMTTQENKHKSLRCCASP